MLFRLVLATLFVFVCTIANAANPMPLAEMGISDLQPVDGMKIRGKGFAHVYGLSYAYVSSYHGGAGSVNGYTATSHTRRSEAVGENQSFAAYNGHTFIAGGFSQAYAK
jgi:hypothetical protein